MFTPFFFQRSSSMSLPASLGNVSHSFVEGVIEKNHLYYPRNYKIG